VAKGVSARLSPAEARKFGLVVGAAFVVLGAVVWWRSGTAVGRVLTGIGGALILTGLVVPNALVPVNRAWMTLALVLSKVTTPIFLGLVYFGIITPIGLIRRVLGHDTVKPRPTGAGFWVPRTAGPEKPDMKRQF
jgi:saxitoxin biosynthesis operon SxtJ-like protein